MINVSTPESRAKFYASSSWKALRVEVLERDNYECLWCKENGKVNNRNTIVLEIDHIVELEHHPEFALNPMTLGHYVRTVTTRDTRDSNTDQTSLNV